MRITTSCILLLLLLFSRPTTLAKGVISYLRSLKLDNTVLSLVGIQLMLPDISYLKMNGLTLQVIVALETYAGEPTYNPL